MDAKDESEGDTLDAPEGKPKKPGTFQKGDPRISHNMRKAQAAIPKSTENEDGLDDAGRMRKVWEQSKHFDENTPQRLLRRMLDDDTMGYYKLMLQLEGKNAGAANPNVLPPDEAEDRVKKLLLELIDAANRATLKRA